MRTSATVNRRLRSSPDGDRSARSAMPAQTILVVEDEPRIAAIAADYLRHAGYQVTIAADGAQALEAAEPLRPDLVVLDLGLPGIDGLEVTRTLRVRSAVPIIMVTARVEEADRLPGLETGADDYLTKPFSPRELVARVKAVLRRTVSSGHEAGAPRNSARRSRRSTPTRLMMTPGRHANRSHGHRVPAGCDAGPPAGPRLHARAAPRRGPRRSRRVVRSRDRRARQERAAEAGGRHPQSAIHPHRLRRRLQGGRAREAARARLPRSSGWAPGVDWHGPAGPWPRRSRFVRRLAVILLLLLTLSAAGTGALVNLILRRTGFDAGNLGAASALISVFVVFAIVMMFFVLAMRRVGLPFGDIVGAADRVANGRLQHTRRRARPAIPARRLARVQRDDDETPGAGSATPGPAGRHRA